MPRTPPAGAFCGVVFRETGSKPAFQLGEGGSRRLEQVLLNRDRTEAQGIRAVESSAALLA